MRRRRFVTGVTLCWLWATIAGCNQHVGGRDAPEIAQSTTLALGNSPRAGTSLFVEVFDANTQQPLPDATVRIVERAGKTDALGRIVLDNLVPGETLVSVRAPGYVRVAMNTTLNRVHAALRVYLETREWTASSTAGEEIQVPNPDGLELFVPPNSLVDPLGRAVQGTFDVHVTRFDATKDLGLLPNPPMVLDESTRAPLPIHVAKLVAIEIEQDGIPLSLAPNASIHIRTLVNAITQANVGLPGFGQDSRSGRWERSTASEVLQGSIVPGKMTWSAELIRLGWLAPGLPIQDTREILVRVESTGGVAKDRSVLVRAVDARSMVTGFTDETGIARLLVPAVGNVQIEVPTLLLAGVNGPTSLPDEETYVFKVDQSPCPMAGESEAAQDGADAKYCDGFTWGDYGKTMAQKFDAIGWRCGTDQQGVCSLGIVDASGACKPIYSQADKAQAPERCNGLDDNCNGVVDENPVGVGADCMDSMSNQAGKTVCNTFGAIVCKANAPLSELPGDGVDNDGDGLIDEGFCTPGALQQCAYTGAPENAGVGACTPGVQACEANGQWGMCTGEVAPSAELPNGLDDDCDGLTDEVCNSGQTQTCYTGSGGTADVGVCKSGSQTCDANGQWGICAGEVMPTAELPNSVDDDCDGLTDEVCNSGQTQACYTGSGGTADVGVCKSGSQTCAANGQWGICSGEVLPGTETCNGLDDDCNGQVDDNSVCANACLSGCTGGMPDGVCDVNENSFDCAQDCACGDGTCSGSETPQSCHVDCKFSNDANGMCGNGYCDPWEVDYGTATIHCVADCKLETEPVGTACGDGTCAPAETSAQCPADCGTLTTYVNGNDVCETGEHWSTSVDCTVNVNAGTFLEAKCQGYALVATYADGLGGTTSHTITSCSESCGAAPWRLLTPNPANNSFDGNVILRPDCTTCTIMGTPATNIVGDAQFWGGWVYVYTPTTYEMNVDPNKCNHAIHPYNPGTPFYSYLVPLEWEKVSEKDCSITPCNVWDCAGTQTPQNVGVVGVWKPAYGSWSTLAASCQ